MSNSTFNLAADFVNFTNNNIFLTGKAGTGKTTFLKHIKNLTPKNCAVVAPTGVAAINAGGVTIHSFFQVPFNPYVPTASWSSTQNPNANDRHSLISKLKVNKQRNDIINKLDLLIIDEISMVRADLLDAIDTVLRHIRRKPNHAFGGVQVLLIGDMHQLPPVVPEADWEILKEHYKSPYFFDSKVITDNQPLFVELDKVYRQSDKNFINLLNQLRNNELEADGYEVLQSLHFPDFEPEDGEKYITLATHNAQANTINDREIIKLDGVAEVFNAKIDGDFSEKAYPAEVEMGLKVGAQVMFIKNDSSREKRYFNGKIGEITAFINTDEGKIIEVTCPDGVINVGRETWENIKYSLDGTENKVKDVVIGTFKQYPLRLAWAISIHKSQGLTFERAIIDASKAFAPGQVYVALSRCTTLEGVKLLTQITSASLHQDSRITEFSARKSSYYDLENTLESAKFIFMKEAVLNIFDYKDVDLALINLEIFSEANGVAFNAEVKLWIAELKPLIYNLQGICDKFKAQLHTLLNSSKPESQNDALQERVQKAAVYFLENGQSMKELALKSVAVTQNKELSKLYNKFYYIFVEKVLLKEQWLQNCQKGFEMEGYLTTKNKFELPTNLPDSYAQKSTFVNTKLTHPELFKSLKAVRDSICEVENKPVYLVLSNTELEALSEYLPQELNDLKNIKGFGDIKIKQYGSRFLEVINAYCMANNLGSLIHLALETKIEKPKAEKKVVGGSQMESLTMYLAGKTIEEIAKERGYAMGTISTHLSKFIETGQVEITKLISQEKVDKILPYIKKMDKTAGSTAIKLSLNDDSVSYDDIRYVISYNKYLESKKS